MCIYGLYLLKTFIYICELFVAICASANSMHACAYIYLLNNLHMGSRLKWAKQLYAD